MVDSTQNTTRPGSPEGDWSNYWQGRAAEEAGAALVGVGIEANAELEALWARELDGAQGPLLDVACGAGTVLRAAKAAGIAPLQGIDISADALTALAKDVPETETSVADAAKLPFANGAFATVTSQFGVEYADRAAFGEAWRMLAPQGRLVLVCHHAGGAIADEVRGKRDAATALRDTGFVARAKAVFAADDHGFEQAAAVFGEAQDTVLAMAKCGDRLAAHLYSGTQQLYQRRAGYALSDIEGWLDGMDAQVAAFLGRMQSMLDAALDEAEARNVANSLNGALEAIQLGGADAAWLIRATKA